MVTQKELEALLETLATDQPVSVGVGEPGRRGWFRAQVVSHDVATGRLVLTCFMDRPTDRLLEPGERVVVSATRMDAELHSAPMDVEYCGAGPDAEVHLRMAGAWQPEGERRHQVRVPLQIAASRARHWVAGAWHELEAAVVDLSSRGVGLKLDREVRLGDRVSLVVPLNDGHPELRTTVEIRHVHADAKTGEWRAGGLFRGLPSADHERVIRCIFAELRSRS
jgi:PilZ domain-containing protein